MGIIELLGGVNIPVKVVDVGAMDIGPTPYDALLELGATTVIGFEPNPVECEKLQRSAPASRHYLPYFVGDGSQRTFHWCKWAATSSLYPPHDRLLRRFTDLHELVQLADKTPVSTTRLDDIPEVVGADFVKIDVQGATLDVLHGGPRTIAAALVVQCEAEFVPLYEGEPLFAEIDQEMRRLGFLFHRFMGIATRTFAPLRRKQESGATGQMLWTDAVYVRRFLDFASLDPASLIRLALILERVYGSRDLALLALQHHDAKTTGKLWEPYLAELSKLPLDRPPID